MAEKSSECATPAAPQSAARFVRRGAEAIRARRRAGAGALSQRRAEYLALVEWAENVGAVLPFSHVEQFAYFGDGAEHRVYYDAVRGLAIKSTHPNRFGYSARAEAEWATPVEYLKRLAWQNRIFGDECRVIGVAHEEDQLEIVTSQPWINSDPRRPRPEQHELDAYFGGFGFVPVLLNPDAPLYFNVTLGLLVADAHNRNVLRTDTGELAAIDLVIGVPGLVLLGQIRDCMRRG